MSDALTGFLEASVRLATPLGLAALRLLGAYLRGLDPSFSHKIDAGRKIYRVAASKARGLQRSASAGSSGAEVSAVREA